jgi:Ca2+-binding EF-hand superfamily protein
MGKMSTKYQSNKNPQLQNENKYFSYEQNQFNDFLKKLMEAEAQIEDAKINLSLNPDFNCEDAFRLFEENDKGYLDENDLKYGLNLIGLKPSDQDIKLLMKRFDLQKSGGINYADFFDIIVPFEKNYRLRVEDRMPNSCCPCRSLEAFSSRTINELRDLFNLIINLENEINNMRKMFGTLRLNLRDIFGNVDTSNKGFFTSEELIEYLDNNQILMNVRDADLLYIRLDKNRNGKIDYSEVEDEIQTVY